MTIREIEVTVDDLRTRHPDLDEALLATLLSASGWEDKTIKEATIILRGRMRTPLAHAPLSVVPPDIKTASSKASVSQNALLDPYISEGHQLLSHYENNDGKEVAEEPSSSKLFVPVIPGETPKEEVKVKETSSLVTPNFSPAKAYVKGETEIPHDLPLRPFESAPHVWPFSRYKDVFYGEVMPTLSEDEKKLAEKHKVEQLHMEVVPLSGKEEGLITMACVMLLVILLLLGYMYSNGRL